MMTSEPQTALPEPCAVLMSTDTTHLLHELSVCGPLSPVLIAQRLNLPESLVRAQLEKLLAHGLVRPFGTDFYSRVHERIVEVMELAQRSILGE